PHPLGPRGPARGSASRLHALLRRRLAQRGPVPALADDRPPDERRGTRPGLVRWPWSVVRCPEHPDDRPGTTDNGPGTTDSGASPAEAAATDELYPGGDVAGGPPRRGVAARARARGPAPRHQALEHPAGRRWPTDAP